MGQEDLQGSSEDLDSKLVKRLKHTRWSRREFIIKTGLFLAAGTLPVESCALKNIPEIKAETPINWETMNTRELLAGLTASEVQLNRYSSVTFLLTEHGIEDKDNTDKMAKIKNEIAGGICLIPEYIPEEIARRIETDWLAAKKTNAKTEILPFYEEIMRYGIESDLPVIGIDPANWESFLYFVKYFKLNNMPPGYEIDYSSEDSPWVQKMSLYRNTINAAMLVALSNKCSAEKTFIKYVFVTAPAHGNQILEILKKDPKTMVSLAPAVHFMPYTETNKTENKMNIVDQFSARYYTNKGGKYVETGKEQLLPWD